MFKTRITAVIVIAILLFNSDSWAGAARQKALAAVAVARARIKVADQKPPLQDTTNRFLQATPQSDGEIVPARQPDEKPADAFPVVELQRALEANAKLIEDHNRLSDEIWRGLQELDLARKELVEAKEQAKTQQAAQATGSEEASIVPPPLDEDIVKSSVEPKTVTPVEGRSFGPPAQNDPSRPMFMRMELSTSTGPISEHLPAQMVIGHWAKGCPVGDLLVRDVDRRLTKLNWKTGESAENQVRFIEVPSTIDCPTIWFYQNGTIVETLTGYQDPIALAQKLRSYWDSAPNPSQVSGGSVCGSIQASSQVRMGMGWFRDYIGEGVKAQFRWDRSGMQAFPLLAKGDWGNLALLGRYGHFQLSAFGAKNLPLQEVGFGYKVDDDGVPTLDLDPIVLKMLTMRVGPNVPQMASGEPPQVGLMTLWTIVTVVRDIFSILNPTCDLQLGGCVSATAVLNGDTLSIDFQQCPSIKLVALFTFQLQVNRIEVKEHSVRVLFGGSRLVKERTFEVK